MAILLSGGLVGCDVPTEAPEWEQRWIVPAEETTFGVDDLLPDGVLLSPGGTAFAVSVDPITFDESLGNLCGACLPLEGLTAPKPGFQSTLQEAASLPNDVEGATVQDGQIRVEIRNGFGFDPIRPAAGVTGTLTMSLYDGSSNGNLLDQVVADGATESFPGGSSMVKTLDFSGEVGTSLMVLVEVNSPAGDPVLIDTAERLTVDASVPILSISSARVDVSGQEFTMDGTDMDLEDVDEEVADRVISGAIEMQIENPWSIGATVNLTVQSPGNLITKGFNIPSGATSTARVEFTQAELRSILGQPNVVMGGSGVVVPSAGAVTLTPGQTLSLDTRLDLVIRIGGGEG
jgi:hypothetical protein